MDHQCCFFCVTLTFTIKDTAGRHKDAIFSPFKFYFEVPKSLICFPKCENELSKSKERLHEPQQQHCSPHRHSFRSPQQEMNTANIVLSSFITLSSRCVHTRYPHGGLKEATVSLLKEE